MCAAQREADEMTNTWKACILTSYRVVQVLGKIKTLILFTPACVNSHIQCFPWEHSYMFYLNEGHCTI